MSASTHRKGNQMNANVKKYGLLAFKVVVALAFASAGIFKLIGNEMMVATFEAVGVGQWFRYVTGIVELGAAVLLFVPGRQAFGAGVLVVTMIGAVLTHLFILGPSAMPAVVLGLLSAVVLYAHKDQVMKA